MTTWERHKKTNTFYCWSRCHPKDDEQTQPHWLNLTPDHKQLSQSNTTHIRSVTLVQNPLSFRFWIHSQVYVLKTVSVLIITQTKQRRMQLRKTLLRAIASAAKHKATCRNMYQSDNNNDTYATQQKESALQCRRSGERELGLIRFNVPPDTHKRFQGPPN